MLAAVFFGFLRGALAQTTDWDTIDREYAQVRALFREGTTLLSAGKYEEARKALLQAWQIRQNSDIGAVLGQSELMTGQYPQAAAHLDWSIRNFTPARNERTLQSIRDLFVEAKKHVATLIVKVDHDGADIRVDGRAIGKSPISVPSYVDPGNHEVTATLGDVTSKRSIAVDAGKEYPVTFAIAVGTPASQATNGPPSSSGDTRSATTPSTAPSKDTPPKVDPSRDYGPVYWTIAVGGVATVGTFVSGLLIHGSANSKQDDASTVANKISTCQGVSSPDCDQLASLLRDRNSANKTATILMGASGVLAVATGVVTYLVWPKSSSNVSAQGALWATPGGAGVGMTGTF